MGKCKSLLTFCNNLLKGKNHKAIWEATPCAALLVFGGCFLPLETLPPRLSRDCEEALELLDQDRPPKGRDNVVLRARLSAVSPSGPAGRVVASSDPAGRNTTLLPSLDLSKAQRQRPR